jgi:hypothetical protein
MFSTSTSAFSISRLSSALPSREALAEFTRTRLNENLEVIAGGTNLAEALFKLIQWSEANGNLHALVEQAYAARPLVRSA